MPIYEYHCNKCSKDFELLLLCEEKVECPYCKGNALTRILSVFSAHGHGAGKGSGSGSSSSCSSCTPGKSCATCKPSAFA